MNSHSVSLPDLELLIDSSEDFILSVTADFTIKYANKAFCNRVAAAYGLNVEFMQTKFLSTVPEYLHDHYRDIFTDVLRGEEIVNETFRSYPGKNLADSFFEEKFKPVFSRNNQLESVSIFIKNITNSRKIEGRLQENEAILSGVFDSCSDEILSVNKRYEITSCNAQLVNTLEQITSQRIALGINIVKFLEKHDLAHLAQTTKMRIDRAFKGERFTETENVDYGPFKGYREVLVNPIYSDSTVIGASLFSRDITAKMQAEKKVRESEAFLKTVQTIAQIGSWRQNVKTGEFSCTHTAFEIFELRPVPNPEKELFEKVLGSDNVTKIQNLLSASFKNSPASPIDLKLNFGSEKHKILQCTVETSLSPDGELHEVTYVFQDVTGRRSVENKLEDTSAFLSTVLESTDYAVITDDLEGNITSFNRGAEMLLGYSAGEVVNKHNIVLWHDREEMAFLAQELSKELGVEVPINHQVYNIKSAKDLKNEIETTYIHKNGKKIPVLLNVNAIKSKNGEVIGYVGVAKDLSEIKKIQNQLTEQNNILNTIINNLPFDFWVRDEKGEMIKQNNFSYSYWGNQKGKYVETQTVPEQIRQHWIENNKKAYAGELVKGEVTYEIEGAKVFIQEIVSPIFDEERKIKGILGINIDITERKLSEIKLQKAFDEEIKLNQELAQREEELTTKEEELRQSIEELSSVNDFITERERQISAIFDNSPDIIVSIDKRFRITAANKAYRKIYQQGVGKEFQIGIHIKDSFTKDEIWNRYSEIYNRVLKGEHINQITDNYEEIFGRYISDEYYSPIKNEYGEVTGIAVFIRDITEKELEKEKNEEIERIYNYVINSSSDVISFFDKNYVFKVANEQTKRFVKNNRGLELNVGKSTIHEIARPELLPKYLGIFERVLKGEQVEEYIERINNNGRELMYTEEYYYPVYDKNNEIIGIANYIKNVTERTLTERKRKELQEKFSAVLDSSTDYIVQLNKDLTIGMGNSRYLARVKNIFGIDIKFNATSAFELLPPNLHDRYKSIFEKAFNGENFSEILTRNYENGAPTLYTEEHFFPIFNEEKNEVVGISIFARDITERILAEQKIKEQERRFASVINSSTIDGILVINSDFYLTGFNEVYKKSMLTNYGIEIEPNKYSVFDLLPSQLHDTYLDIFSKVKSGKSVLQNSTHPHKNGGITYTEEAFFPIFDEHKNVVEISVFIRDITERKQTELKIKESEELLSISHNIAKMGCWVYNVNTQQVNWSKGMYELLEIDENIELDKNTYFEKFLEPNEAQKQLTLIRDAIAAKSSRDTEFDVLFADGRRKYMHGTAMAFLDESGEVSHIYGTIQDISERKISEKKIIENELRFRLIAESTTSASYDFNIVDDTLNWYGKFDELYGLEKGVEFTFEMWENAIHEEDRKRVSESFIKSMTEKDLNTWIEEYRIVDAKGKIKYVIDKASFIRNETGEVTRALGGMQDVSIIKEQAQMLEKALHEEQMLNEELAQREEELTSNEEQLRLALNEMTYLNNKISESQKLIKAIIDSTDDYVFLVDRDLTVQFFNQSFARDIFKNQGKEIKVGDKIFDYSLGSEEQEYTALLPKVLAGESVKIEGKYLKERDVYRDEVFNPIFDNEGTVISYAGFIRDISDKVKSQIKIKESEEMLRVTQRIAKLGSWKFDLENNTIEWSDETYRIYGVDKDKFEVTFDSFLSLYDPETRQKNLQTISWSIENKASFKLESTYKTPKGEEKFLLGIGNPKFDKNGKMIGLFGSVQDITERKEIERVLTDSLEESQKLNEILAQREEELTSSEEELRTYVEELSFTNKKLEENQHFLRETQKIARIGSFRVDIKTGAIEWSDSNYEIYEVPIGTPINIDVFKNAVGEKAFYENMKVQEEMIRNKSNFAQTIKFTTKTGQIKYISATGIAKYSPEGELLEVLGTNQDITESMLFRQKLEESESNLKAIINNTDFSIWAVDKNLNIIAFNNVFADLCRDQVGITPYIGMQLFQGNKDKKTIDKWTEFHKRAFTGEKFATEIEEFGYIFESYFAPIPDSEGNIRGVAVINNNITGKKAIERQIKASEEKFRALFEKSRVSMMLFDDSSVIDCNTQTLNLLQVSDKNELYPLLPQVIKSNSLDGLAFVEQSNNIKELVETHQERVFDWTHTKKDGTQLYGEIRVTPIEIDGKEVLFTQFYDLTERKVAESKILESENFLNSIIDNMPIGIMVINTMGDVVRMNASQMMLSGLVEDWRERGGLNLLTNEFMQKVGVSELFKRVVTGGVVINEEIKVDFNLSESGLTLRDDVAWFLLTAFPIYENKKVKSVVTALIEITQEKKNEEKIQQNAFELIESNKKMAEYKLMALRSVMNPHFLFNSLNSIQYFIAKNEREQALNYLSLFSKLIRSILNSSVDNSHTLAEEISILRFYTDLETLRFENKFEVIFEIDDELDQDNIEIPSLILQPYVENAILHGLYNKTGEQGILKISFTLTDEDKLLAVIEDNGVGRVVAKEIKQASRMHRSVGMLVTQERLELINKDNNLSVRIIDKTDNDGNPTGTKVEVTFNI